jgi:acyl-coenzyme A thioesterase PaaI-like protein
MTDDMATLVREVHKLAIAARIAAAPPPEVLSEVRVLLKQAQSALDEHAWHGPYAVEQLAPPGNGTLVWDAADLRKTVPYSPILGELNPTAGNSEIWCEQNQVRGTVTLTPVHAGPISCAHGGVIAALLDELANLAVLAAGGVGYTQTLTTTYRRRTPIGQPLELRAHTAGQTGDLFLTCAEIRHDGKVTASAVGVHRAAGRRDEPIYPVTDR